MSRGDAIFFEVLEARMTKEELVEKIKELLKTNNDLDFLLGLKKEEIERLVACIRDRVHKVGE
jgi:mevalonate kinase